MQTEKVRIFSLAREMGMESRDLVNLCRDHGIDVKNQLSTVESEVRDQIVALVNRTTAQPAKPNTPPTPVTPITPRIVEPLRNLDTRKSPHRATGTTHPAPEHTPPHTPETLTPPVTTATIPQHPAKVIEPPTRPVESTPPAPVRTEKPVEASTPTPPRRTETPSEIPVPNRTETPVKPTPAAPITPGHRAEATTTPRSPDSPTPRPTTGSTPPPAQPRQPIGRVGGPSGVRNLNQPRPGGSSGPGGSSPGNTPIGGRDRPRDRVPPPAGRRQGIVTPPAPKQPSVINKPRPNNQAAPVAPKSTGPVKLDIPIEALVGKGGADADLRNLFQPGSTTKTPIIAEIPDITDDEDDGKGGKKGDKGKRRPGEVVGRDSRRNERAKNRKSTPEEDLRHGKVVGLLDDDQPRKYRRPEKKKIKRATEPRKGKVPIQMPITIRSLSEAIGTRSNDLLGKLFTQGVMNLNINSLLDAEMAEILAHEFGCELEIKRAVNVEEDLETTHAIPNKEEDLILRAPVVTIMGHVDHGKTSLLDKIRRSNVAATEAGGITQVIRAWRVEHGGRPVTFLDTPGHEAFTKMRARGANVTDIAVIVVAVDDGVMPQTEEAISHAKAAGVSIVVAINKVDLPNANIKKTEQQLYGLGLIPDNMGGDVPFVYTSAATGKGIDELLETLSLVAELKELKANPNKPGRGVCLESHLSEGQGVLATVMVQDGTLRRGDIIVCGAGSGRVRAMYDDFGKPLAEAGPSVPVVITGLDEVPNADDKFLVVPDLATASEIANKRRSRQKESSQVERKPITLESLKDQKVTELKVILKAEARGSIEAIRKELEKLHHEEVQVRVLHAAIGGITESDVQLALTSPSDTFIVGFNVVPDERARFLADERGIQMKQYNIIYNLTNDIRAALEGKLKPREEIIHLGRAVVRETFKISRVGTIAGCRVTQGTIERSAKIRLIRGGVVIYPPAERTAGLESLKRFKDDVREVRDGYDCGIKIAGYDDIKVDDVVEAYRVEQVQRTLNDAAAGR